MDSGQITVEEDDLYLMTNVHPKRTGLPFVVFISLRGAARHDVRVKVAGPEGPPNWSAVVSVRPDVQVLQGALSAAELSALDRWIALNREVIIDFWNGAYDDSADVIEALRAIGD